MSRFFVVILACVALAGCTPALRWPWPADAPTAKPTSVSQQFSFAWRLSGDRAVAPLQVFDDGKRTWLQFADSQAVPAIFASGDEGQVLLNYTRQGPYVVLPGVWDDILLRGGSLVGRIQRSGSVAPSVQLPAAETGAAVLTDTPALEPQAAELTAPSFSLPENPSAGIALPAGPQALLPPAPSYHAGPQDLTMRAALAKWAQVAGWTFEPEHWVVDVDIPLAGSASFKPEFKSAVRELLASTELGERPLQPCFYSNNVLRIVPLAQACDRSVGVRRTS